MQTCRQLNLAAQRRQTLLLAGSTYTSTTSAMSVQNAQSLPLLACRRVKVRFNDEPGEGSGVARAFYTAFSLVRA